MGWRRFLDSLDSSGGHIVVLLFLVGLGLVSFKLSYPGAQAIVGGSIGAILYSMRVLPPGVSK
jgi:hypothetical protein